MIIIEAIINAIRYVALHVARFIFWIITARDCKHCKYRQWNRDGHEWYEWGCYDYSHYDRTYHKVTSECYNTITRKKFKRRTKK